MKEIEGKTIEEINQEWEDYEMRLNIRMAVRCKQRINNIPMAIIPEGSARQLWNGYRGEEK